MIEETTPSPTEIMPTRPRLNLAAVAFDVALIALILIGVFFRFNKVNWNLDTDLHPDEYGLTSTLTQLSMPKNLSEYFNTRISPISPYQKYDENGALTNHGPDNRMRWGQWPLIIIRGTGEMLNTIQERFRSPESGEFYNYTGYGEMRLMGRTLSGLADTLSLLMIFLIGARLYGRRVGLLAAALSALAVMQIQQSHFMTVDHFAGLFTTIAMYGCVRIAQSVPVVRVGEHTRYTPNWRSLGWYALFGLGFGMALASKINLAPLGGMVFVAAFISVADVKLKILDDLRRILGVGLLFLAVGLLAGAITFRLTQPMTFRTSTVQVTWGSGLLPDLHFITAPGDTTLLTLTPNPDWADSMEVAQSESGGEGGGPPGEQWAHRTRVLFAFTNMVMWGMGLALGLACWFGFAGALWQVIRGRNWRAHLLPLVWAGGYFIFMGTRWVMSTRYFLPIYPFMCLLAAWGLLELWRWVPAGEKQPSAPLRRIFAATAMSITILGALAWATAFVQAVYETPHTRIQAARWIFHNMPGPFHLSLRDAQGNIVNEPVAAMDGLPIIPGGSFVQSFIAPVSGELTQITLPHAQADGAATLRIVIASDPEGTRLHGETQIPIPQTRSQVTGAFENIKLTKGELYFLIASTEGSATVSVYQTTLANESWDEGLPMRFDGRDPFGGLYRGLSMEVRWPDDENKKNMFLDVIGQVDYIIMPSQRGIWSTCRIPLTYPMTMDYYRALFDGRLGFDQAAAFSAPIKLGPLQVSDVGGTFAWNQTPPLPLFNSSWLAAEEAFSVYDHPPVWIFKKRPDFNIEQVKAVLDKTDLSQVINQGPTTAEGDWCPEK